MYSWDKFHLGLCYEDIISNTIKIKEEKMIIGALKETKYQETRVAVTPDIVGKYKNLDFEVMLETGLGIQSGFDDDDYIKNGALVLKNRNDIFQHADILVNVWALPEYEYKKLKKGQILIANFENDINYISLA